MTKKQLDWQGRWKYFSWLCAMPTTYIEASDQERKLIDEISAAKQVILDNFKMNSKYLGFKVVDKRCWYCNCRNEALEGAHFCKKHLMYEV